MKQTYSIFLFVCIIFLFDGCAKKNDTIPFGNCTNYNQSSGSSVVNIGGPFSFTSIEINPNPVQKGNVAKVIAKATGNNLTFKWSTPHGELFGNGSQIYYSDSCVGTFQVTCTVSDGTNSVTITVPITIIN
jgi:hypothetical protein